MLKNWLQITLGVAASYLLVGCQAEENAQATGLGWAKFAVELSPNSAALPSDNFSLTLSSADSVYSYTWADIADYLTYENLHVGRYTAKAVSGTEGSEGYDCPCYIGEVDFTVLESESVDVKIPVSLSQSLNYLTVDSRLADEYSINEVTMHSVGGNYLEFQVDATEPLLLSPGVTYLYITISDASGREVTISPSFEVDAKSNTIYEYSLGIDEANNFEISCGGSSCKIQLTDALFSSDGPQITTESFQSGEPVSLMEGFPSARSLVMNITSEAPLKAVVMTLSGTPALVSQFPEECDLLTEGEAFKEKGLDVWTNADQSVSIDFTTFLESLSISANSVIEFAVHAFDELGRASDVSVLNVAISTLEAQLTGQTDAIFGENIASVTLQLNSDYIEERDFSISMLDANGDVVKEAPITSSDNFNGSDIITLYFSVGEGVSDVPIRIDYLGKPKAQAIIKRIVPEYSATVDAYANHALIQILAPDALAQAVAQYAYATYDGSKMSISGRDSDLGIITLSGLNASKTYEIKLVTVQGSYTPTIKFTTESAAQVPEGDFEDVSEDIDYHNLAQGGIYSNTTFPIYNMQNHTDVNVWWPNKYWANVNAKTFCTKAKNHNTWYMQTSTVIDFDNSTSGSKCMRLSSVGWSVDGEEIQPYLQQEGEQLPYNANVPNCDHRAAAKLFLGSYKFDYSTLTETYTEGVTFNSRPSSLNGYYKYSCVDSDESDYGTVEIMLINDENSTEIVVGTATMEFHEAPDFITFNLPIEYKIIGTKATKLKMMFCSSRGTGTIDEEDTQVPVDANVELSEFRGSVLWIDNLTFAY
ncbi:MAG: DUF4493 domain-containing protein [Bacteroidales bacterium]|nr:DUF4493 domain-containing protein [Bacteroidales bacterium]